MKRIPVALLLACSCAIGATPNPKKKAKVPEPSTLDRYLKSASAIPDDATAGALPGALWSPAARLNDMARDLRASQVNDVVTILVTETINAAASGASTTERASSANASITSLAGPKAATSALSNLLNQSGDQKLNGTGTTTRAATLNAVLTARVVKVLPGGLLYIEGAKDLQVNSEQQAITVRGIIRTDDITTNNTVGSTQIADMEIRVNGKGIVGDAIRRPNFLYRLILGLLPF
ncbi:MAG TPA: flagellar basal body L-ring protein FlgH [Bryobacteraceae bacterium]|jgi:flagellar L-ring protein precursor FlgH|nr:flagellar basal body L-ring protein FlgH [Bryobacteraceae bacterium]